MSSSSEFHDQDFDALENRLDNLPPATQYEPFITRPLLVWWLGRRLAWSKRTASLSFSSSAEVDFIRPVEATGGWITIDTRMSDAILGVAEREISMRFTRRGLVVTDFQLRILGIHDGPNGTYETIRVRFTVS